MADVTVDGSAFDTQTITATVSGIQTAITSLSSTLGTVSAKVSDMNKGLTELSGLAAQIPDGNPLEELEKNVKKLNTSMSGLSAAIGTLSTNVATLDSMTDGFSAAYSGILHFI